VAALIHLRLILARKRNTAKACIPITGQGNFTDSARLRHTFSQATPYSAYMRAAFVLRLGPDTKPSSGLFEGWVEEVDSGKELRFHSADELLGFIGQRFSELTVLGSSTTQGGTDDGERT
jgi:hypothetical protein